MSITPVTNVVTHPSQVAKALLFIAVALGSSVIQVNGIVTLPVLLALILQFLTLIPVYFVTGTNYKVAIAFASALIQALIVVVGNTLTYGDITHISWVTWLGISISAFAAIGIGVVPNKPLTLVASEPVSVMGAGK